MVLVNGSAGVAKNFCALELATTFALQAIFARGALRGVNSEDSGPGRHEKKEQKRGILIRIHERHTGNSLIKNERRGGESPETEKDETSF